MPTEVPVARLSRAPPILLPNEESEVGEIDPARQLRDPAVLREDGKTYLFYTFCGEQGIAGAVVSFVP